jgi:Skp family chaperone for outer membrane proteins
MGFPTARAQTSLKVGVFDPQRISEETAGGRRVQAELSALRDQKQQDISIKEQAINELQQQLNQQALSLSVDRRATLEMDIRRRLLELNNAKDLASQELQFELTAAQARFNDQLIVVVEAFGREEAFDLVFDRTLVAWASGSIDVTTAIIDRFDKMFPSTGE